MPDDGVLSPLSFEVEASFSDSGECCWGLEATFADGPTCMFVLARPVTGKPASDLRVARCVALAHGWGYGAVSIAFASPLRADDEWAHKGWLKARVPLWMPEALADMEDDGNELVVAHQVARHFAGPASLCVAAWGHADGIFKMVADAIVLRLTRVRALHVLGSSTAIISDGSYPPLVSTATHATRPRIWKWRHNDG